MINITKITAVCLLPLLLTGCLSQSSKAVAPASSDAIEMLNNGSIDFSVPASGKIEPIEFRDGSKLLLSVEESNEEIKCAITLFDKEQDKDAVTLNLYVKYELNDNGFNVLSYDAWAETTYGYRLEFDYSRGGCRYTNDSCMATGYFNLLFWEHRIALWGYKLNPTITLQIVREGNVLIVRRLIVGEVM